MCYDKKKNEVFWTQKNIFIKKIMKDNFEGISYRTLLIKLMKQLHMINVVIRNMRKIERDEVIVKLKMLYVRKKKSTLLRMIHPMQSWQVGPTI